MGDEGTVTVRIIKSFEYKNYRSLIFHGVALQMATLEDVARLVRERIEEKAALAQYRACTFDTFKMYYQPFGAKTSNPMINLGNDEALILADEQAPLAALGIRKLSPPLRRPLFIHAHAHA